MADMSNTNQYKYLDYAGLKTFANLVNQKVNDSITALSTSIANTYLKKSDSPNKVLTVKYTDDKNQIRTETYNGMNVATMDLSKGLYYATTSTTATRVSNTLNFLGASDVAIDQLSSNPAESYNGARVTNLDFSKLARKATTLTGYGITNAYTKTEVDDKLATKLNLSGGTLTNNTTNTFLTLNNTRTSPSEVGIGFLFNSTEKGWIGYNEGDGTYLYTYDGPHYMGIKKDGTGHIDGKTILHSGNYTDYTVPKTGGTFSGNVTAPTFIGNLQGTAEIASISRGLGRKTNEITTQEEFDSFLFGDRLAFTQFRGGSSYGGWDNSGVRGGDGMLISVPWANTNLGAQLVFDDERPYMALRAKNNGTWSGWEQIAFTSSNVASAAKLHTPRTLWGRSFDGTGNVSGNIIGSTFFIQDDTTNPFVRLTVDGKNAYFQNIHGNAYIGSTSSKSLMVAQSGNVGIGTTSPTEKLEVSGNVKATTFKGNLDWSYIQNKPSFVKASRKNYTPAESSLTNADILAITGGQSLNKSDWNYAGNGYITTPHGNIDLAGCSLITFGTELSNGYTQLFITAPTTNSDGITNEMLFYNDHGAAYNPGWTRIITNHNFSGFLGNYKIGGYGSGLVSQTNGVTEIGRYLDFHYDTASNTDFNVRVQLPNNTKDVVVNLPSKSGFLALTSDIPTKLSQFTDDVVSGNYLPINGTAPSSNTLQWASFTAASGIGFNLHQWFASGKVSDIPSMSYSTVFQAGLNMSRAWQIWVSRTDHATHTRHTDGTNWTEEYTLLDDHNYTNYTVPKTGGTFTGNVTFDGVTTNTKNINIESGYGIYFNRADTNYMNIPDGDYSSIAISQGGMEGSKVLYEFGKNAIYPNATKTKDLGTINKVWNHVYAKSIGLAFNTGIDLSSAGHVNPGSSTLTLGEDANRWGTGYFSGAVYAAGGFYESSDERLKTFGSNIDVNFKELAKIRKSHFVFNDNPEQNQIGISAQEIQKLYPEVVTETASGYLNVDYAKLSVVALAAIDKLNERIEYLESKHK